MQEFELISKYLSKLTYNNPNAKMLNDDVFFDKKNKLVISVDCYNEGIHFKNFNYPGLVIKKIIRSSISDLICKGVKPKFYFISSAVKKGTLTKKKIKILIKSLNEEQKKFDIKISGGDTTYSKTLSFTVVSVGFSNKIIERNKTRKHDDIYITGDIGDSYLGLQILNNKFPKLPAKMKKYFIRNYYMPKIPYKFYKVVKKYANASIDVSDGLFGDLSKLINNQNTNYCIYENRIPISKNLSSVISKYNLKKRNYISNGDDYQILFTASKKYRSKILSVSAKMNQKISIIGDINDKYDANLFLNGKKSINLTKLQGYSHSF